MQVKLLESKVIYKGMTVLPFGRGQFCMVFKGESHNCSFCLQSWDIFFRNTNAGAPPGTAYQSPLSLSRSSLATMAHAQSLVEAQPNVDKLVEDHLAVQSLIRAYQVSRGCPSVSYRLQYSLGLSRCVLFYFSSKCQLYPSCFGEIYKRKKQDYPYLSNSSALMVCLIIAHDFYS